ncbi:hypothetical protein ACFQZZ_21530 [Nocardia sp. GCM10030253]|uniref:hypothetical protein n=1 Tax=Nocardia sp. GCM10030253 TaxID=3273404 RepID=UPI0036442116
MTEATVRAPAWPLMSFRIISTAVALLVLVQAALAGDFLSGRYEALALHSRNGSVVAVAMLGQAVAATLLWRKGFGPSWPVRTSLIQLVITGALIPLGENRILAVHIPLAVGLAIGTSLLVTWAWRGQR